MPRGFVGSPGQMTVKRDCRVFHNLDTWPPWDGKKSLAHVKPSNVFDRALCMAYEMCFLRCACRRDARLASRLRAAVVRTSTTRFPTSFIWWIALAHHLSSLQFGARTYPPRTAHRLFTGSRFVRMNSSITPLQSTAFHRRLSLDKDKAFYTRFGAADAPRVGTDT